MPRMPITRDEIERLKVTRLEVPYAMREVFETAIAAGVEFFDEWGHRVTDVDQLQLKFRPPMESPTAREPPTPEQLAAVRAKYGIAAPSTCTRRHR